jgi:N-methylhydantoinase A
LRVGPRSAGAEPGPACYGRGGTDPTVTDAHLVLGYLDPEHFAGGAVRLDPARAREAVERVVAKPLGLSVEAAALGIHRIVNAQMAEGIRLVSIRQGHDPRRFTLLPLGGAGPLHACALAQELGILRILVPRHPGVLSAAGLLAAPIEHEAATAFPRPLETTPVAEMDAVLADLDRRCAALMAADKVPAAETSITYFADLCYAGQAYHLEVPLQLAAPDPLDALRRAFYAAHDRVYGYAPEAPVRLVNLRSLHRAEGLASLDGAEWRPAGGPALRRRTRILLPEVGPAEAAVYDRAALAPGDVIEAPAIVEQADTTTLVAPGWSGQVDAQGNLILERQGERP